MLLEIGDTESLVIATDGSSTGECNRASWGFVVYQDSRKIAEECGSHKLYTSSTRMEVEAVNRALKWLSFHHLNHALLSRIKSGWVPEGWVEPSDIPAMGQITWTYVPGHAGVSVNEEADCSAAASTEPVPLPLYYSDIDLLGSHKGQTPSQELLCNTSEGCRLRESGIGASARS